MTSLWANRGTETLPVTRGRLADLPRDTLGMMQRLKREHGDIAALVEDDHRVVFVFSPQYNKQVLNDTRTFHARFFAIRGPKHSAQRRLTSGLLSMNEDQHKRHRRMLMGPFQRRSFAGYGTSITDLANQMLDSWQPGQVRDIAQDMTQYMLRVTSTMLFGFDRPELSYRIGESIDRWVGLNHRMGVAAVVPNQDCNDIYEELLSFASGLEEQIMEMIRLRRADKNFGEDVLSLLLRTHDEGEGLRDEELIGHTALLFGAAHLTTAHTLTWTLFLLAQHPSIAKSVHDEVTCVLDGRPPTSEDFSAMPVVERVIKESMRVLPSSAYSQRMNVMPVRLGPFQLPPGTPVMFSQYMTHHRADLFPAPERFIPDRWKTIAPSPYAYLPFGAGPRMCIGGPLALTVIKIALPMILQRYRLTVVPEAEISGNIISTMLTPITPVSMLVSKSDRHFQSSPVRGNIHEMVDLVEAPRRRDMRKPPTFLPMQNASPQGFSDLPIPLG